MIKTKTTSWSNFHKMWSIGLSNSGQNYLNISFFQRLDICTYIHRYSTFRHFLSKFRFWNLMIFGKTLKGYIKQKFAINKKEHFQRPSNDNWQLLLFLIIFRIIQWFGIGNPMIVYCTKKGSGSLFKLSFAKRLHGKFC